MGVYSISNCSLQLIIQARFAELVNTGYKVNIEVELIGKALALLLLSPSHTLSFSFSFWVFGCIVSISNVHLTGSRHNIFV